MRWEMKNGIEDLKKAQHFLEKYIEIKEQLGEGLKCNCGGLKKKDWRHDPSCPLNIDATRAYVDQD